MRIPLHLSVANQMPFWHHMRHGGAYPLITADEYPKLAEILQSLEVEIDQGRYRPQPLLGRHSNYKGNGIPRPIPVLTPRDYCVYFACIRTFDEKLFRLSSPSTYGGWSLENGVKRFGERMVMSQEEEDELFGDDQPIDVPSANTISSFTKFEWVKYWKEYSTLLDNLSSSGEYPFVFKLDIANYYNTINRERLLRRLRAVEGVDSSVVDLLDVLLEQCEIEVTDYVKSTSGIPQELIGDCSRILANLYLSEFDDRFESLCRENDARYVRWVDDITVFCPQKTVANRLLHESAKILGSLGLNVNSSKTEVSTVEKFRYHWQFEAMNWLNQGEVVPAIALLRNAYSPDNQWRVRSTALKRALTKLRPAAVNCEDEKQWLIQAICSMDDYLLTLQDYQYVYLFNLGISHDEILRIAIRVLESPFTIPKIQLFNALCNSRLRIQEDWALSLRSLAKNKNLYIDDALAQIFDDIEARKFANVTT